MNSQKPPTADIRRRAADWLDPALYPFASHVLPLDMGRMHYIDEGGGPPIVAVHGNPAWSFLYRHLVSGLSGRFRCVAPDLIGFGLSDKPTHWSYRPEAHAANLARLLDHLGLDNVTLVGQDWGGPIAFSWAVAHPERVRALVIMNTWMWSVRGDPHYELFSRIVGGPVGRRLIRQYNLFVRVLMPVMFRGRFSASVRRHYEMPLARPADRIGCAVFPGEVIGSSDWLDGLWRKRERIRDKPALILWGLRDIAFRQKELERWRGAFSDPTVMCYPDAGHFVQEHLGPDLAPVIEAFLENH